jgi:cytochrome c-type biogenesis protein
MDSLPTVGMAFVAGVLSFISPCVLPLIPVYISYLTARASGQTTLELSAARMSGNAAVRINRMAVLLHGAFFVAGFTLVFVASGMIIGLILPDARDQARKIGGILIILFGLHVMGLTAWALRMLTTRIAWEGQVGRVILGGLQRIQSLLYSDTRRQMNPNNPYGYAGSTLMGVIFAAGWAPCIGPILGSILSLAAVSTANSKWLGAGGVLLIYSLGLGLPFLLAAVAIDRMRGLIKRLQRSMRQIEFVSGLFLIAIGLLLVSGELWRLSEAGGSFANFTTNLSDCTTGLFSGSITTSEYGTCIDRGEVYVLKQRMVGAVQNVTVTPTVTLLPTATPIPVSTLPPESVTNPVSGLNVGQTAPDFTVKQLDGQQVSLSALQGKIVLLNFWATWCGPCRAEMPSFQALADKYRTQGFEVLAVNYAEQPDAVGAFVREVGFTFRVGLDPSGVINRQYHVGGYPTSYVIGRDGAILERWSGPVNVDQFEKVLQVWLVESN